MIEGTVSREDLVQRLQKARKGYTYEKVKLSDVQTVADKVVIVGSDELEPTPWAYSQMLKALKIPKTFYEGLEPKLQERCVLHQRAQDKDALVKLRRQESKLTAVLHPDYAELKVEELLMLMPDWQFTEGSGDLDARELHFRAHFPGAPIVDGEYNGYDFAISEVGGCPLTIAAVVWVLVCSNGLMRLRPSGDPYFQLEMSKMEPAAFEAVCGLMGERLLDENERLAYALEQAKDQMVDAVALAESWLTARIPMTIPKKVLARLESEDMPREQSIYDIAQLVSNIGLDIAWPTRRHFEILAGNLLGLTVNVPAAK